MRLIYKETNNIETPIPKGSVKSHRLGAKKGTINPRTTKKHLQIMGIYGRSDLQLRSHPPPFIEDVVHYFSNSKLIKV